MFLKLTFDLQRSYSTHQRCSTLESYPSSPCLTHYSRMPQEPKRSFDCFGLPSFGPFHHLQLEDSLLLLTIAPASLFGSFSQSGFSLSSPGFLYSALRIKIPRTSHVCSVGRTEMRASGCSLSALIGSTFLDVGGPCCQSLSLITE